MTATNRVNMDIIIITIIMILLIIIIMIMIIFTQNWGEMSVFSYKILQHLHTFLL